MKAALSAILVCAGLATQAAAQPRQDLVQAELLADVSAVKPGETFTLGVLLTVEPQWHIYWINPGDSGRATTVKIDAPEGFTVGPVRYPVPVKFNQPGDVVGYGYDRRVLLTADVKAPAEFAESKATISAEVSWLCCKEQCIPGKARLSITLPLSEEATPANDKVFAEWKDRFPREKDPAVKHASWQKASDSGTLAYNIEWSTAPKKVELYPGADDAIEIEKIDIVTKVSQTRATVKARVFPGQKPESDRLPSLLVYTDANDVRHGIDVSIPLDFE